MAAARAPALAVASADATARTPARPPSRPSASTPHLSHAPPRPLLHRSAPCRLPPLSSLPSPTAALDPSATLLPAAAAAATLAAVAAAGGAAATARVDFAVTARLSAVTPPAGTRALLLVPGPARAASRTLFLLPNRITDATVVGPGLDEAWWARAGAQAGVRVDSRARPPGDLAFLQPGAFDVALAVGALGGLDRESASAALAGVARALAQGGALVLAERRELCSGVGGVP